jgi:hypothetical protein
MRPRKCDPLVPRKARNGFMNLAFYFIYAFQKSSGSCSHLAITPEEARKLLVLVLMDNSRHRQPQSRSAARRHKTKHQRPCDFRWRRRSACRIENVGPSVDSAGLTGGSAHLPRRLRRVASPLPVLLMTEAMVRHLCRSQQAMEQLSPPRTILRFGRHLRQKWELKKLMAFLD